MTCAHCGRNLGPAAKRCIWCGKAVGEAPAAPNPVAAPVVQPPTAPPEPAPSPAGPFRPAPRRHAIPVRRASSNAAKVTIGGVIGGVLVLGLILLRVLSAAGAIGGRTIANEMVTLQANQDYTVWIEALRTATYEYEVTPQTQAVLVMHGQIADPKNITQAEVLAMLPQAQTVAPGMTKRLDGNVGRGKWAWIVLNQNEVPVQVFVKFHAR